MTIISNRAQRIAGVDYLESQVITWLSAADESDWIGHGWGRSATPGAHSTPVNANVDPVTGGIGITSGGVQVGGTASPYAFTTRALTAADNGQTCVCASAQTATVNTSMPVGFGVAVKGAVSFTAGSGVTITDVRTTGSANPWCALTQTGVDTYDVLGVKA